MLEVKAKSFEICFSTKEAAQNSETLPSGDTDLDEYTQLLLA